MAAGLSVEQDPRAVMRGAVGKAGRGAFLVLSMARRRTAIFSGESNEDLSETAQVYGDKAFLRYVCLVRFNVLDGAGGGQIEALADDSWKVQHLCDDHPVFASRQMECDMVLQHSLSMREVSTKPQNGIVTIGGSR